MADPTPEQVREQIQAPLDDEPDFKTLIAKLKAILDLLDKP